jgi:hypothetical protein
METEPTENEPSEPYLPATSPAWAQYYKRAKETRRLGRGQHTRIQRDTKRRRRHANMMILVSTAALVAVIAAFCALLGSARGPEPEGNAPSLLSAHARRG